MAKLALAISFILIVAVISTYPDFTANDRFVGFAILLATATFILIYMYVTKQKLLRNMLLIIAGMAGFAFVLVPLYDVFCEVTGINGKLDVSIAAATPKGIDYTRQVTVEFVVTQNKKIPWEFKPKHTTLVLHPGELATTAYFAKNLTSKTMRAQAVPSISPSKVSRYFKKTECFCFSNQKLGPGESAYLGLRFYLDPEIPEDVQRITLSYTIFDISGKD